jgi:hypothetical protein
MSINYQRNGTALFVSDADPTVTQLETGKTPAQIAADYVIFQATWPLAYWQRQRLADNYSYMTQFVNWVNFFDGGTITTVTAANVGSFIASAINNYRTKKASINAATTSAQVIAIDVTTGYPANP